LVEYVFNYSPETISPSQSYRFPHGNLNSGPAAAAAAKRRKSAENRVFG
jgi:hypothetical protein